jgi:hypothetical protein
MFLLLNSSIPYLGNWDLLKKMDPSDGARLGRRRGARRTRCRSVRGGSSVVGRLERSATGSQYWNSGPPPPTFADSWGFTLPDAYQAPLAATWAAVHFREGSRIPNHVFVNRHASRESSEAESPWQAQVGCEFCGEEGHTVNNCQLREACDRRASAAQDLEDTASSVQGTFDTPSCDGQILPLESAQDVAPPTHMPPPNSPAYTPTPDSPQYISDTPVNTPASPLYISDSPVYTPASPQYVPDSPVYTPASPSYAPNASPHYTPTTPLHGQGVPNEDLHPFLPMRGLRRTGIAREYLKKYSHHP